MLRRLERKFLLDDLAHDRTYQDRVDSNVSLTYQFGPFASDYFLFNLIIFIINKLMFYNGICSIVVLP